MITPLEIIALINKLVNCANQINISALIIAVDIMCATKLTFVQNGQQSIRMIIDVKPVKPSEGP